MRGHGVRDKWLGSEKMPIGLYCVQVDLNNNLVVVFCI